MPKRVVTDSEFGSDSADEADNNEEKVNLKI